MGRWHLVGSSLVLLAACSLVTSLDGLQAEDAAPRDATLEASDAPAEAQADADSGIEASVWHDMTNPAYWSVYDLANITSATGVPSFNGGTFDGRYAYFAPT